MEHIQAWAALWILSSIPKALTQNNSYHFIERNFGEHWVSKKILHMYYVSTKEGFKNQYLA